MIRCPIICVHTVCTYSNANDPTSAPRYSSATNASAERSPAGMYWSMTTLVRYGGKSSRTAWAMMAATATATCDPYG
jgi:hypothetical protein